MDATKLRVVIPPMPAARVTVQDEDGNDVEINNTATIKLWEARLTAMAELELQVERSSRTYWQKII